MTNTGNFTTELIQVLIGLSFLLNIRYSGQTYDGVNSKLWVILLLLYWFV